MNDKYEPWELPGAPGENKTMEDHQKAIAAAKEPRPRAQSRFDRIISALSAWRNADHEDNLVLCRSDVIEIIEGIKFRKTSK